MPVMGTPCLWSTCHTAQTKNVMQSRSCCHQARVNLSVAFRVGRNEHRHGCFDSETQTIGGVQTDTAVCILSTMISRMLPSAVPTPRILPFLLIAVERGPVAARSP